MKKLNRELQYRVADGSWRFCAENTDYYLARCVKNDYRKYTMDQVIEILNANGTVRNSVSDWYSECRIEPIETPVPDFHEWEPDTEEYGY